MLCVQPGRHRTDERAVRASLADRQRFDVKCYAGVAALGGLSGNRISDAVARPGVADDSTGDEAGVDDRPEAGRPRRGRRRRPAGWACRSTSDWSGAARTSWARRCLCARRTGADARAPHSPGPGEKGEHTRRWTGFCSRRPPERARRPPERARRQREQRNAEQAGQDAAAGYHAPVISGSSQRRWRPLHPGATPTPPSPLA